VAKKYKFLSLLAVAACYGWFIYAATTPDLPSQKNRIIFYSNQRRQDLYLVLREAFKKAFRSIHLTMYALTDTKMIETLQIQAASGVDVQVFYDPSAAEQKLPPPIQSTPVKSRGLMHRKIALIDDAIVFLGSANMTTSSLSLHDNLTCGLYHPGLSHYLKAPSAPSFPFEIQGQPALLWLLPDKSGTALKNLLSQIGSAKKSLSIAMFTLTHPVLVEAVIQAHRRGVEVTIATDYYAGRGAGQKAIKSLKEAGVKIVLSQGVQLLHHKWAYIDRQTVILGSTNWTKAAFTKNQDCLLFLFELAKDQQKYLDALWKTILLESKPV
jgi:phosphatidylserine/phosphatidylglycerophosphate/cardiolipin synthase-like enzyme